MDLEFSKAANCFIPHAATSGNLPGFASGAVRSYGKRHGGLWVGGRIHLRGGRIWFGANALNRAFHSGLEDQGLNLADVVSVEVRPGILTKIIDVSTNENLLRFRCFRAGAAAEAVMRAVEHARGASGPESTR